MLRITNCRKPFSVAANNLASNVGVLYRLASSTPKIVYTETDEAPALATYSLLPIVKKYAAKGLFYNGF